MLGSGLTWAEMLDAAGPLAAANASFPMRGSARMHLALCPRCAGCSHALRRLDGKVKFGGGEVESGPEGISQAYTMAATQIGQTRADVAKVLTGNSRWGQGLLKEVSWVPPPSQCLLQ